MRPMNTACYVAGYIHHYNLNVGFRGLNPYSPLPGCLFVRSHESLNRSTGSARPMINSGLVPWHVLFQAEMNFLQNPLGLEGERGATLPPHRLCTAGGSPFACIQLRMLVKITESSCYLKHKNYSVSAAMSRAEGGCKEKPQPIACVSFCLLAKGGSS